jgi:hypothetical protein
MESVRNLFDTHLAAEYPRQLAGDAEVNGVSLIMLDADIAGLAQSFLASDGVLRSDEWYTLRECAEHARSVLPAMTNDGWVHFARLYALTQAILRSAPVAPRADER